MAKPICSVPICDEPAYGRGWCKAHHQRWLTKGDPGTSPVRKKRPGSRCSIADCGRAHYARGWCKGHYERRLNGNPLAGEFLVHPVPIEALTYHTTHKRLAAQRGPAADFACIACDSPAHHWAYQHNDPNEMQSEWGPYSADIFECYAPMCASCHAHFDRAHA